MGITDTFGFSNLFAWKNVPELNMKSDFTVLKRGISSIHKILLIFRDPISKSENCRCHDVFVLVLEI